jgi:hypothetical protein
VIERGRERERVISRQVVNIGIKVGRSDGSKALHDSLSISLSLLIFLSILLFIPF